MKNLEEFENLIGVKFSDRSLIKAALTHRSYKACYKRFDIEDNERLEFLGDSVLNLCISKILFEKFPKAREGELTKKRAYLVCKQTLVQVAKKINLLDFIYMGRREERLDPKSKENIAARALEAVIGAIFLDKGFSQACNKIKEWFLPVIESLGKASFCDYKTRLQEVLQRKFHEKPTYEVLSIKGPPHNPEFEVAVKLRSKVLATGKGCSKKEAEVEAAKKALPSVEELK